jgi:hypothetical protein
MKLGSRPCRGVRGEEPASGPNDRHRDRGSRPLAVAAEETGPVGQGGRFSHSSRLPLAPARGQLPGGGQSGGVRCRLGPGGGQRGHRHAGHTQGQSDGETGQGAGQDSGRTPL